MHNSGFISKAACRGYRPRQFASYDGRQRARLIARLIKDRACARFIVAPFGYGKTSLAIDYAETVFSWAHVFWLNAQSPCFIRDLDDGDFAAECLARDNETKLVVIDDLPQLDAQRVKRLSDDIDMLIKHGCEVIVTSTPSCDLMGQVQRDRLRLGASELLLDDDEVDAQRTEDDVLHQPALSLPASARVPLLAWGAGPDVEAVFASGSLDEDLPADVLLTLVSVLVLQQGSVSDLASLGPVSRQLVEDAFADYPHLGFDLEADRFEAPVVSVDAVAQALKRRIDGIVACSAFESRMQLVVAWADMLLGAGGSPERACEVVRTLCPPASRPAWMLDHECDLVRSGCFQPWLKLLSSLHDVRHGCKMRLAAAEALCRRMLGDEDGSLRLAKRCAFDTESSTATRVVGLLLTVRAASGELRNRAAEELAAISHAAEASDDSGKAARTWWDDLAHAWCARAAGVDALAAEWLRLDGAGSSDDVLCLAASWFYALMDDSLPGFGASDAAAMRRIERYVRGRLAPDSGEAPDFLALSAGLSMEEAHARGLAYFEGPLKSSTLLELRRAELSVAMQRRRFQHDERAAKRLHYGHASYSPGYEAQDGHLGIPSEQRAVPVLDLCLFGRFDVSIGGVPVDGKSFARKNTRVLLVLLAVNRGRDLSREAVISAMWPNSSMDVARRNFYTVWSQLKRALTLNDGTCPYLVRHQFGCHLEERYVRSDVARLDDICRELLFGRMDYEDWRAIYTEIDRDFASELMPAETANPLVVQARERYRNRLVDALVAATMRLIESGNPQCAIWFARSALAHANTREDAYVALMRAQIANDQRTAAMMTYLACRRVLSDELGIDPSSETDSLYNGLLDDE